MAKRLKIAVLGVGHLGKIHLKCIQLLPEIYELVGFYDPDETNARRAIEQYGVHRFSSLDELLQQVEVVDIVTPTPTHFELAHRAISQGKHVFIEKPITQTPQEAHLLLQLADQHNIKGQVGFVERFNPAFQSLMDQSQQTGLQVQPKFVESHRLAMFNPRGTDVSVVLDLMIHDLDILLHLIDAPVTEVRASGVSIVSPTEDIANARIEFADNTVANLTASRISLKNMRKFRLFQQDAYISIDFLDKKTEIVRMHDQQPNGKEMMALDTMNGQKFIDINIPESKPINAIQTELRLFAESILLDRPPTVSLLDGVKALDLAYQIMDAIDQHQLRLSESSS